VTAAHLFSGVKGLTRALKYCFVAMLGDFDLEKLGETSYPPFVMIFQGKFCRTDALTFTCVCCTQATFMLLAYVVLVSIMLLNLLIAMVRT